MAAEMIQTSDLQNTFKALRNQDPAKMMANKIPYSPDYKTIPQQNLAPTSSANTGSWGNGMAKFASGVVYGQPQFFSPVHTPINWQIPSKRLEQYQWARFFYENEPKVASAIDFYSYFPMNNYNNECKDRKIRSYFDKFKKRLELPKWTRLMSHEVHLLGDCFPFIEVSCPICGGSGRIGDELCEHEGGTVRRIVILNPDYVEVYTSPLNPEPVIALKPDEELINMVQKKTPGYERLTPEVIKLVTSGQPIRLDNRNVFHLKYGEGGYSKYGVGMVRRLFPILSYKTKLMVAQWIVAERLIVPIKVIKVGTDERPAGPADIAAVQSQLAQTANDPNLTIVTHHAFDLEWYGACFSSDTEVLTENGWKKYEDVSKNFDEKIATYNLNNEKIEYEIPQKYHEYNYDGDMVSFESKDIDILVTPNHKMLIKINDKWGKVEAQNVEEIDGYYSIKSSSTWDYDFSLLPEDVSINSKDNVSRKYYNGKVWCFTVPNGFFITRRNGKVTIQGNSGKVLTLSNEFEFINQEILDGLMINNALLNGEGPNFTHSDDTRLLTNNGLKYRQEFDMENDLVATFNIHTKEIEYQKATEKFEYDWNSVDGDDPPLKRFKTNRIDMLVTPNHRMLCSERKLTTNDGVGGQNVNGQKEGFGEWKCIRAHNVKKRTKFRSCVDGWTETTIDEKEYFGIKTPEFLQILGWYISEGYRNRWIKKDDTESITKVSFSQCEKANKETYDKMTNVMKKNGIYHMTPKCKNVFYIRNKDNEGLVKYLASNCGGKANSKCIPKEIKNMSQENLKILLNALVEGDGNVRPATKKKETDKKYYSYTTVSTQLRDDVVEILFKLGFSPRFAKIEFEDNKLQTQYTVSWSDGDVGRFPVLDSRKWNGFDNPQTQNQVIFDEDYIGKVWCVEVPNHFIITERNGLFGVHGNSSAAVGIEAMIERLETFRNEISDWIEECIYKPEAIRQGFVEIDPETEEEELIYPSIKWNSMHLRDQQQHRTFMIQLYEKGLVSAQTVLETFDLDPDQEIERKRYDAVQMMALGQGMGQMGGAAGGAGGGGMPPMGGTPGDMGGMPGGDMGGAPGGDMGGGAPIAPGGDMGGAPAMASSSNRMTTANPSDYGGKVLKQKTRERLDQEKSKMYHQQERVSTQQAKKGEEMRDGKGRIVFTKPERLLMDQLVESQKNGLIKYPITPQYEVAHVTGQNYLIDFAIPSLKIGIEADGEAFHSSPKQVQHDSERDMQLSQTGWTILRFSDSEIEKIPERVTRTIIQNIMQKELSVKKQQEDIKSG